MKWISRLFWLLLLVAIFLLALLTVNQQQVSLRFLDFLTPELSVFWWLLIAFATGLSLGLIAVMINSTKSALLLRKQRKVNLSQEREIEQLRELKSAEQQQAEQQGDATGS